MEEPSHNPRATVPEQPEAKPPLRKGAPVIIALVAIVALIGIANLSSLVSGNKKSAPASALPMRPSAPNAEQVNSFQTQQQSQARLDAEDRQHRQELAAAMQQLEAAQAVPGPEASGAPPMTAAQRAAIYGDSPNAPAQTSNMSQAQAEAKQKALAREKQQQDVHLVAAVVCAIRGDWDGAADQTFAMANGAAIAASEGQLGLAEAAWDITAAALNAAGREVPTSEEWLQIGVKEGGELAGEGVYSPATPR